MEADHGDLRSAGVADQNDYRDANDIEQPYACQRAGNEHERPREASLPAEVPQPGQSEDQYQTEAFEPGTFFGDEDEKAGSAKGEGGGVADYVGQYEAEQPADGIKRSDLQNAAVGETGGIPE